MAIITTDMVVGMEWTDIPLIGDEMILDKVSGSKVKYRMGVGSNSLGMDLTGPTMLNLFTQVRSVVGTSTIIITKEG